MYSKLLEEFDRAIEKGCASFIPFPFEPKFDKPEDKVKALEKALAEAKKAEAAEKAKKQRQIKELKRLTGCMGRVQNIYVNEAQGTVTVKLTNGITQTATCAKGDSFDVEMGIAVCLASVFCGSKKRFHEICQKKPTHVVSKE